MTDHLRDFALDITKYKNVQISLGVIGRHELGGLQNFW